jgi:hypothetical protein
LSRGGAEKEKARCDDAAPHAVFVRSVRGDAESPGWPDEFRQALAEALAAAD